MTGKTAKTARTTKTAKAAAATKPAAATKGARPGKRPAEVETPARTLGPASGPKAGRGGTPSPPEPEPDDESAAAEPDDDTLRTADLAAVIEQAIMLNGRARPSVVAGRSGWFEKRQLRIPGWLLGVWNFAGGRVTTLTERPQDDFRIAWLAETGHLLWIIVDTGVFSDDTGVIVSDTPRSFRGSVCGSSAGGGAVWDHVVHRVPLLAACPHGFAAWSTTAPRRTHPGGPALLADAATRALDVQLAAQIRKVTDPRKGRGDLSSFNFTHDDEQFRVLGTFVCTTTARAYPAGAAIPADEVENFLFLSSIGTWITKTAGADGSWIVTEFDTVRDLYRFAVAGRPASDVVRLMWNGLTTRHPLARDAEGSALARWR